MATGNGKGEFLTVEEACNYLRIGRAYLYRLARRHSIARYRRPVNGRKVLFRRKDLDKLRQPRQA